MSHSFLALLQILFPVRTPNIDGSKLPRGSVSPGEFSAEVLVY